MRTFKVSTFLFFFHLFVFVFLIRGSDSAGTQSGSEAWGYVEARPKAHMFWWYYKSPHRGPAGTPWPLVLWLQGGPGASGVGYGNFQEIGPLDVDLKPRASTWLQVADLLFVDSPVGTGFSYVEDKSLLVKTDQEAASDLTTLLKTLFNANETLQASSVYIVAESYGGKFAVTLGVSIIEAITTADLNLMLKGVVLGDSWISPEDFVASWGPLLKDVSRLGDDGLETTNSIVTAIKQQIQRGDFTEALAGWGLLEAAIMNYTNNVDFYNFLLDAKMNDNATVSQSRSAAMKKYSNYLSTISNSNKDIASFMNNEIRKKLGIIPDNVVWGSMADSVFLAMADDFMRPRLDEVDILLRKGINVTIYNGQLDVICATMGAEAWLKKLKWPGLKNFSSLPRKPIYCGTSETKGFVKAFTNLRFYWILNAGHFVPVDQPCIALKMITEITAKSRASSH